MIDYIRKMLMDKTEDAPSGGAPASEVPLKVDAPKEEDHRTQFYKDESEKASAKESTGDKSKEVDPKKEDPAKEPEKVATPATGYDKEPEKVEEEPKKEEVPPVAATDLEKKLEGLNPYMKERTQKQLAKYGLEGKKVDDLIADAKFEQQTMLELQKKQQGEFEKAAKTQKLSWYKELKEDPDFGGKNFEVNTVRAEKVLDEYLPRTKKMLTEGKQMLPPYIMRDLAKLADRLYPEDKLVTGEPIPPKDSQESKETKNDPLSFYTN
ncbi:MAG TPA: hypothetical protein VIJ14_09650 [Rhabdochlamydiaceae bacterium]